MFSSVPFGCFFLGSCWLLIAFVEDITNELTLLTTKKSLRLKQCGREFTGRFCSIVKSYSKVKELSGFDLKYFNFGYRYKCKRWNTQFRFISYRMIGELNIIFKYPLLMLFLFTIISVSSSLLTYLALLVGCKKLINHTFNFHFTTPKFLLRWILS